MGFPQMTLEELRAAGLRALDRELGPIGLIRFLQQFQQGRGDYSADRTTWLDEVSLDSIRREVTPGEKSEE